MIETFTYKTIGDCKIDLDIHLPDQKTNTALPLLLWFHGGGLIQGTRKDIDPHLLRGPSNGSYCLVAADYRLAPQVSVADIVQDALDALAFVRTQLVGALKDSTVKLDTKNVAVSGSSAGGYLALLLALRDAEIKSSLAIYPITDPLEAFFTTHQETKPYDLASLQPFIDASAKVSSCNDPSSARNRMYYYMLDQANLADLLHIKECRGSSTVLYQVAKEIQASKGQVGATGGRICPIFIVHGNADVLVGVNQAYIVRDTLVEQNLTHEFLELEGLDHGFDEDPSVTLDEMYTFMERYWSK